MVNSVSGVQQNDFDYILFRFFSIINWASLVAQTVMNPPAVQETWVQSLDREDPLEKGMATHSRTSAWRIPWTEQPVGYSLQRANSLERLKAKGNEDSRG